MRFHAVRRSGGSFDRSVAGRPLENSDSVEVRLEFIGIPSSASYLCTTQRRVTVSAPRSVLPNGRMALVNQRLRRGWWVLADTKTRLDRRGKASSGIEIARKVTRLLGVITPLLGPPVSLAASLSWDSHKSGSMAFSTPPVRRCDWGAAMLGSRETTETLAGDIPERCITVPSAH